MPLRKGTSRKTISNNIREFHTGKTFRRTEQKFGRATAERQAVAAALSTARRRGKRNREPKPDAHNAIGEH